MAKKKKEVIQEEIIAQATVEVPQQEPETQTHQEVEAVAETVAVETTKEATEEVIEAAPENSNLITDRGQIKQTLEAIIFAAPKSITLLRLKNILNHFQFDVSQLKEILEEIKTEYQDKGFQLVSVNNGYQFRTHPGQSEVLQKLLEDKPARLSPSALEVLAIVAYKQPITRAEIDSVRGVDSGHLMKGLLEKNLVRSEGHAETPGRPLLFGTTPYFLEVFSLGSLDDLPNTEEMKRELAAAQGVDGDETLVLSPEAQGGYDGLLDINSAGLAAEPDRGVFDIKAEEAAESPDFGVEERAREEVESGLN
jgi:segregation and condensation protein B